MLLQVGGNGEGGIQVLIGEARGGSCRKGLAAAKYRLDSQSSSRKWLGTRRAEIEWENGVWGEARCCFIGARASGGGGAAINQQLGGVSSLSFEDERGGEDSTRRLD
jgi:hypothetical protein